jgi:hypothetical protein
VNEDGKIENLEIQRIYEAALTQLRGMIMNSQAINTKQDFDFVICL